MTQPPSTDPIEDPVADPPERPRPGAVPAAARFRLMSVGADGKDADPQRFRLGHLAPGQRIGILGGSFNPAHAGHLHISVVAMRRLRLHGILWLLSPQNPLKPVGETAPLPPRAARARRVARHPRIVVSDWECGLGTRYTAQTLPLLKRRYPAVSFVWLMGADNLIQLPRWQQWRRILDTMPMAVIARPHYGIKAQLGLVAQAYCAARVQPEAAPRLVEMAPPAWTYVQAKLNPLSASVIRQSLPDGIAWTDVTLPVGPHD